MAEAVGALSAVIDARRVARVGRGDAVAHVEGPRIKFMQYWINTGKKVQGPFSASQLRTLTQNGKLKPKHRISSNREQWVAAESVKGLTFPPEDFNLRDAKDGADGAVDPASRRDSKSAKTDDTGERGGDPVESGEDSHQRVVPPLLCLFLGGLILGAVLSVCLTIWPTEASATSKVPRPVAGLLAGLFTAFMLIPPYMLMGILKRHKPGYEMGEWLLGGLAQLLVWLGGLVVLPLGRRPRTSFFGMMEEWSLAIGSLSGDDSDDIDEASTTAPE